MRKPVRDYEGIYEVDEEGNVYSLEREVANGNASTRLVKARKRKLVLDSRGYLTVGLHAPGKKMKLASVHRLVAEAFIPNPDGLPQIDHINEDKHDNRVGNLRWVTQSMNQHNVSVARKDNKSCGVRGVTWNKQARKWHARIKVFNKSKHLGLFTDINDAKAAYEAARAKRWEVLCG